MSKPFFIWTMRRTGGTSLTVLLEKISEYQKIQHEPFNGGRVFGNITQDFHKEKDIRSDLDEILKITPLIKHCYELFDEKFNTLIVNASIKQNYKHIFLIRENEVSRIMSLFLALQTGVWGQDTMKNYGEITSGKRSLAPFDIDAIMEHYHLCQDMTKTIQKMLTSKNVEFKVVSFEDFYSGSREKRLENINKLFNYLEFNNNDINKFSDEIEKCLFHSSQNSKDILEYVPNYNETLVALSKIPNSTNHKQKKSLIDKIYNFF